MKNILLQATPMPDWQIFGVWGIIIVLLIVALRFMLAMFKLIDQRRESDNDKHEKILEALRIAHSLELERKRQDFFQELNKIIDNNNKTFKEVSDNTNAQIRETNSVLREMSKEVAGHVTLLNSIKQLVQSNLDKNLRN